MRKLLTLSTLSTLSLALIGCAGAVQSPRNPHLTFDALQGSFEDGPAVTRACLSCHEEVGAELLKTAHWTWRGPTPGVAGHGDVGAVGKINLINNFCIAVPGNEGRCAQCHVGYGWVDDSFDFEDPSRADCLACHDGSGAYRKAKIGGGLPAPEVDLGAAARSVGRTSTASCGGCHFHGGGDDNVKLPNMGTRLLDADPEVDVHMGGAGLTCTDCHEAEGHRIAGSGVHLPVLERSLSCAGCHEAPVHDDDELEAHAEHVACQACHIPLLARSQPTKVDWRWSEAGDGARDPAPEVSGKATYHKKKGAFQWSQRVRPVLAWYDGRSRRMVLGETFDPAETPVTLAAPVATIQDAAARLYPFKVMRGDQPADAARHVLLPPHLSGAAAGPSPYWKAFDWAAALREGAAAAGIPYSGTYEFVSTEMYMSASHGVAPAAQALGCDACHDGGIDFEALGYPGDPMEVGGRRSDSF
jgi:octaheme c-type cytochrome (tetrathionate reductase family)